MLSTSARPLERPSHGGQYPRRPPHPQCRLLCSRRPLRGRQSERRGRGGEKRREYDRLDREVRSRAQGTKKKARNTAMCFACACCVCACTYPYVCARSPRRGCRRERATTQATRDATWSGCPRPTAPPSHPAATSYRAARAGPRSRCFSVLLPPAAPRCTPRTVLTSPSDTGPGPGLSSARMARLLP